MSNPTNFNGFLNEPRQIVSDEELEQIGAREYRLKFKSAKEAWKFFSIESNKYAPPLATWKQNFGAAVMQNKKM